MHEASNGRKERKNIAMHSIEIKRRQYTHRGDHRSRSHEKIDKEICIPCDKIIMCHNKISEKDTKSVDEKALIITQRDNGIQCSTGSLMIGQKKDEE